MVEVDLNTWHGKRMGSLYYIIVLFIPTLLLIQGIGLLIRERLSNPSEMTTGVLAFSFIVLFFLGLTIVLGVQNVIWTSSLLQRANSIQIQRDEVSKYLERFLESLGGKMTVIPRKVPLFLKILHWYSHWTIFTLNHDYENILYIERVMDKNELTFYVSQTAERDLPAIESIISGLSISQDKEPTPTKPPPPTIG